MASWLKSSPPAVSRSIPVRFVGLVLLSTFAILLSVVPSISAPVVFSARGVYPGSVPPNFGPGPVALGTIPGVPDYMIHIMEVGIGGDADAGSGPTEFRAAGAGMNFAWKAGQTLCCQCLYPSEYQLAPTPALAGSARGFSYMTVDQTADPGAPVTISWENHCDFDGRFTQSFDSQGNYYDDQGVGVASVRVWVLYEYVAGPTPVESSTWGRIKVMLR